MNDMQLLRSTWAIMVIAIHISIYIYDRIGLQCCLHAQVGPLKNPMCA